MGDIGTYRYESFPLAVKHAWLQTGAGPAGAHDGAFALRRFAESLGQTDQEIRAAAGKLGVAWRGTAATTAGDALACYADDATSAVQTSGAGAVYTGEYGESFAALRNSVPAPTPEGENSLFGGTLVAAVQANGWVNRRISPTVAPSIPPALLAGMPMGMGGGAPGSAQDRSHRNQHFLPDDEPFRVEFDGLAPAVLGVAGGQREGGPRGAARMTVAEPSWVSLSDVELDAAWELLRLGPTPAALTLRSPGRGPAERARVLAEVLRALRARGLADRDGPVEPLAAALRALARPRLCLDLRMARPGAPAMVGLGAVAGECAVLLGQRHPEQVRLTPVRTARMPAALVDLAGPLTAGPARPVSLDAALLDAALSGAGPETPAGLAEALVGEGVDRSDAAAVAHIYRDAHTAGQIGATGYPGGRARRAPWVVGFHLGRTGAFLQLRRPGSGARGATVTMGPLDGARLLRHVHELAGAAGASRDAA